MSRHGGFLRGTAMVSTPMPPRSQPQARVLAWGSSGRVMTRSCGRLTVATLLALGLGRTGATVAPRFEAWGGEASHNAGAQRQTREVPTCCVP